MPSGKPRPSTTGDEPIQPPLGRGREQVAPAIDRVDVGGVAGDHRPALAARGGSDGHRARPQLEAGAPFVDQLAPFGGVVVRQQQTHRHADEFGIAVVALAIGKCELGALEIDVQILGRVVSEAREVVALEQLELLQQDRALAPGSALQHLDAAIRRRAPAPRSACRCARTRRSPRARAVRYGPRRCRRGTRCGSRTRPPVCATGPE